MPYFTINVINVENVTAPTIFLIVASKVNKKIFVVTQKAPILKTHRNITFLLELYPIHYFKVKFPNLAFFIIFFIFLLSPK